MFGIVDAKNSTKLSVARGPAFEMTEGIRPEVDARVSIAVVVFAGRLLLMPFSPFKVATDHRMKRRHIKGVMCRQFALTMSLRALIENSDSTLVPRVGSLATKVPARGR